MIEWAAFMLLLLPYALAASSSWMVRPITRNAVGAAMNSEDRVPNTTPRIIANEKLRIESPPRMKIHSSTINVVTEVLMVRASVWFSESLNNC